MPQYPFGRSWARGLDLSLANMEAVTGSLIAYATSPGRTAADGHGRNSTSTKHLLDKPATPGLPADAVGELLLDRGCLFGRASRRVRASRAPDARILARTGDMPADGRPLTR